MSRISIGVSDDEHRKLKAIAALQGKSIRDFVLERTLRTPDLFGAFGPRDRTG